MDTSRRPLPRLQDVQVLVVEDDPDQLEVVVRVLTAERATVVAVDSAAAAIRAFAVRRPDVLVADIGMPGTDGYELAAQIRRFEAERGVPWTPAVALTAYADVADVKRAGEAGYQRHVAKPFDPDRLVRAVADLAGRGPPAGPAP